MPSRIRSRLPPFNIVVVTSRVSGSSSQVLLPPAPVTPELPVVSAAAYAGEVEHTSSQTPFWVSISRKRSFRRLHKHGGCWYTSALFENLRTVGPSDFDERCSRCFDKHATDHMKAPKITSESEEVSSQDVSSSSSEP